MSLAGQSPAWPGRASNQRNARRGGRGGAAVELGSRRSYLRRPSMDEHGTDRIKRGLAEMLKGGVIMDVTSVDQARIAEEAGAVAVMALERVRSEEHTSELQ